MGPGNGGWPRIGLQLRALRGQRQAAVGEPSRRALGLAGVAKQLAFQPIETMGRGEEAIAVRIAHDDSRRLRTDFDDVGVRHCPASIPNSGRQRSRCLKVPWIKFQHIRHTPPPGLAFGEPDDRLQQGYPVRSGLSAQSLTSRILDHPLSRVMTSAYERPSDASHAEIDAPSRLMTCGWPWSSIET